jgi:hypothetical protein
LNLTSIQRPPCCPILIVLCVQCKARMNYKSPLVYELFLKVNRSKNCIHTERRTAEVIYESSFAAEEEEEEEEKSSKWCFCGFKRNFKSK